MNNLEIDLYMTVDTDTPEAWPVTPSEAKPGEGFKDVSELRGRQFEITIANILAPTLICLLDELASKTKPGGHIGPLCFSFCISLFLT